MQVAKQIDVALEKQGAYGCMTVSANIVAQLITSAYVLLCIILLSEIR
jgi:hypothetical protein